MRAFFQHVREVVEGGRPAALATVVDVEGGSRSRVGSRMFVTEDGRRLGSLTVGGCVDNRAAEEAAGVLADGRPRDIDVRLGDDEPDFGMGCAGVVRVFIERVDADGPYLSVLQHVHSEIEGGRSVILASSLDGRGEVRALRAGEEAPPWPGLEKAARGGPDGGGELVPASDERPEIFLQPFAPPPVLVVVGTGPVTEPLLQMASLAGYRTCVVDSREIDGFEVADRRITGIPSEVVRELCLDEHSAVVITAHDYKHEVPVLRALVGRGAGYVGFVASERRGHAVLDFLETTGTDAALLESVRVPVGLDVGAETPSEIAVSILGEMLALRAGRPGGSLRTRTDAPEVEDAAAETAR